MSKEKTPQRIMRELLQPFTMDDLEWRVQAVGAYQGKPWARVLAYVTSRAVYTRLDNVVGCFNWKNEFHSLPNSVGDGALSGISIKIGNEWVTKYDGAENTQIEPIKGGLSGANKRAGVLWGIGRYLYDVEAMYADCILDDGFKKLKQHEKELYTKAQTKDKSITFWWKPKGLDARFLPQKYIVPAIVKSITDLAEETHTKIADILDNYGVDDIRDLFAGEAGQITNLLLQKKKRMEETKDEK